MKFLVDAFPQTCKECEFHAPAMIMTQLGVQKQVELCTIRANLIPPTEANQEPPTVDIEKAPEENNCPCKAMEEKSKIVLG